MIYSESLPSNLHRIESNRIQDLDNCSTMKSIASELSDTWIWLIDLCVMHEKYTYMDPIHTDSVCASHKYEYDNKDGGNDNRILDHSKQQIHCFERYESSFVIVHNVHRTISFVRWQRSGWIICVVISKRLPIYFPINSVSLDNEISFFFISFFEHTAYRISPSRALWSAASLWILLVYSCLLSLWFEKLFTFSIVYCRLC